MRWPVLNETKAAREADRKSPNAYNNKRYFKFAWINQNFKIYLTIYRCLVPSSALSIIQFELSVESSMSILLRVMMGETFRADPLSMRTLR